MVALRGELVVLSLALLAACSDPSYQTVPSDIPLQNGRFAYYTNSQKWTELLVMLSSADVCDKSTILAGEQMVELRVDVPLGQPVTPGEYAVGSDGRANVVLTTHNPGCSSWSGLGAGQGSVTLTSVTTDEVEGSFDATNHTTKIQLSGTFEARRCPAGSNGCLHP